ncbi:MAG TPA: carboxypeptidase regulatory-like domain-containing protein [Gemmatimonadales bacterium]|nr:carboxypeptidase regulatory-like domain-containing protein [Gemmatimonadales bacterium]
MNLRRWFGLPIHSLLLVATAVSLPTALHAQAQATTGVIRGTVTDSTGRAIDNATVTLRNLETNAERTLTTNASGAYVATLLRVGLYNVRARALGFREDHRDSISVRLGETVEGSFALAPQVVRLQELTVSAEPAVEVSQSASATRLDVAAVEGLPNNGRNIFNYTTLTPNVAIVQGPDGDEISVGGQRGIHNNVSVDGADFNNPFFGEQRGGQRPAFTFNLDAVQDFVVVSDGANAEFGRSSGGFINVITKSGTNQFHGSAHYFGKYDALSADFNHTFPSGATSGFSPDFTQHQFGATLGGPLVRDKAFFFLAYDQQEYNDVKQQNRLGLIDPALVTFTDTAFGGVLQNEFGPISRTNDANALLAKLDFRLNPKHNATLKYNYTRSSQQNGTFDVDTWGRSSNATENDHSHAVNGSLSSVFSSALSNEFRFQWSREDRPRPYPGAINPNTGRPFPDTDIDSLGGYRIGMPFFIPLQTAYDFRVQLLDNISLVQGNHLFKFGAEWNRTGVNQTFLGFANGRISFNTVQGFLNYVANGPSYVECSDGSNNTSGSCPGGTIVGPVNLYLQQAGVPPLTVEQAGTQTIIQHELALFLQDSWKPRSNLTLNYGLRWEAQIEPSLITPISDLFYGPFIGQTVTTPSGSFTFPGDGTIPSDYKMFQPRLGFAWDVKGDARNMLRGNAGLYYARIPGLNLASARSTDGSRGQTLFTNSSLAGVLGSPPVYGELLPSPSGGPFFPEVYLFDKDFQNPRTFSASISFERELVNGLFGSLSYTHARTDHLTRMFNANDAVFGLPWGSGLAPGGANGIGVLHVVQSTAKSRYNGITAELRRSLSPRLQFQVNYTVSFDKSDDDNERDPFTFRYARADSLEKEYNWSDRDQRHRFNAWVLAVLPGDIYLNNRVSAYSAQPVSEICGSDNQPSGQRAGSQAQRICPDGHILQRNTLRKDNAFFSWDVRVSRPFPVGRQGTVEAIFEAFNVTNADNFLDPSTIGVYKNFDGTLHSGIGTPRQFQAGLRYMF